METPAEAATAAPADPVSEAEKADVGQSCSRNDNITDAINAAWPGNEAPARFRRAVAGLLLRSRRKCQRPHTMTNTDLGKEVRDQHQHLVAELLPRGGKLKFSTLLLRQPDEGGAGTAPEFFVMEQVGSTPVVRLEVKQLLNWWDGAKERGCVGDVVSTAAGGNPHAPGTSIPAADTEQDAIAVQATAAYATAASAQAAMGLEPMGVGTEPPASTGGAPIPQTSSEGAHVAGAQEHEMGNLGAGGAGRVSPVHGAPDTSAHEEQLTAAAAWPGEGPQARLLGAAAAQLRPSVETAACAAGASSQPCGAAVGEPEGRGAVEDHVPGGTGQGLVDAGAGGGSDNDAAVAWDAAGGFGSRPEADGGPGGHLSTAVAAGAMSIVMQADVPPGGDAPGTSLNTPAVASVDAGYAVAAPGAAQGPSPSHGPGPDQPRRVPDLGLPSGGPSSPLQDLMSAVTFISTQRGDPFASEALRWDHNAPELQALAAALPGDRPQDRLQRRTAALLLLPPPPPTESASRGTTPLGPHTLTSTDLGAQLRQLYPALVAEVVGAKGKLRFAETLRRQTAAPADVRPSWRAEPVPDSRAPRALAPAPTPAPAPEPPEVFKVDHSEPSVPRVRLELRKVVKWWGSSGGGFTAVGGLTGSAAPGQGAGGGAQGDLRPQATGPSGNRVTAGSASPSASPAPPESFAPTSDAQSSHMDAAAGSRLQSAGERPGASTAFGLEEEPLYLGPQRPGHARVSLTAIPGVEGAGGGGGRGRGAVRGGGGKSGMGASCSGGRSAGEEHRVRERRRREVEVAWQVVCRARGHEGMLIPPGLAAACAAAWSADSYVSALRCTAAVLLLVPPPCMEGNGAADRAEEELGPFTLHEDVMECEMAELFPNLTSPMEGNGQKRPLRHFLSNRSAAANSKQGQHEPQQQSQAEDDDADRAESEQDPARPPRLFTVLETHTGHLALRLNLLALQQWWADRNHTHTATPGHGAGRGAGLSPTGRSTSPLPPLNPAEPGLWVEALRGQRGHLAPSPSAGPTYAHTLCNGQGAAGVVGGARVAVRWNRSATCTAFGIVATGLDFQQADAELVDTQLCIKEVRLHRGMQRRRRNVVRAPVIAAAWRGGSAAAQLGRRVAAMLSQPPAAQGPAGPFSMSKAALCSELRAMYPDLVAELLLMSPPQSTTRSQLSPPPSSAPTPDHAGGLGYTRDLPLERLLLLPAYPALGGDGRTVPDEAAHPSFFSLENYGPGQVAVRLELEALGLRGDGEAPALREHQPQHPTHGAGGDSSRTAELAGAGVGSGNGSVLAGVFGDEVPGTACSPLPPPPPPAPRPRSALLLDPVDPVDVGAPSWSGSAAACGPGAPNEQPTQPLTGAPASAAAHTELMAQAPVLRGTAAVASSSPPGPAAAADAGVSTSAPGVAAAAEFAPASAADRAAAQRALSYAWPGDSPLELLWRQVAAVLLQQREGEGGPLGRHSQLSARLSSGLRSSHPALVAQVLPLAGGTLRWATLLERLKLQQHAEGGIAGQQQQQQPGAQTATPAGVQGAAGGSAAAGGVGAGAAWRLPASVPGRFLRSVQHPHDGVVQLDVCGLARWWEGVEGQLQGQGGAAVGGPAQHGGGPVGPAAPLPSPLLPPAQPQPQQPQHQQQGEGLEAPAPALVNDVEAVQGLPLRLLPLWAFPGTAAERAFRRYLAGRLAPSAEGDAAVGPPPGKSLSQLLAVRVSLAAEAHPARSSPAALFAFLTHPDSRGVFRLAQDDSSHSGGSGESSNGVRVTLNPEALCVAAARGLAEAAAAAWPGEGPLPRLRRAAAELLARAAGPAAGPEGEHSMATGNLGHALKRQLGDGYRVAVDSVPGKKLWTALADHPDGPGLIQCDMQEAQQGVAKLRLGALLRSWPRAAAADGALGTAGGSAGPASAAAAADSSVAAGTRAAAPERSPLPPQAIQGHAASASASPSSADPLRSSADAAGPSTGTSTNVVYGPAAATAIAGGAAAPTVTGLDGVVQRLPLRLLPLWAFPGTAPGQVLRRGCADKLLVAQGEQPGPLSLGVLLELLDKNLEALTPHRPQPSSASLAALLNHPDSGGVFQLHQDVRRGISSSTFSVDLVDERLRRMAARGLAEAVAAAWPEDGPLPRLRRAAAVAMACEYDSMPGTPSGSRHVSGEVLAGRLREQLRGQAVPHPGVLPRRLAEGDETELFAVEMRKAVPWARLRIGKLLRDWPQDGAAAAAAAAAADTAAGVADPLLAVHVPRLGTMLQDVPHTAATVDHGLLPPTGVRPPSSTPSQQLQQPSALPLTELSTGGGSDGVQGMPLRLLPMWAFPGTAPGRCLRRYIAYQAVQGHGAQGQGQGKEQDQGQLSLRLLLEQRPRDSGAAAALASQRSVASLTAFLHHPDSRSVFQCNPGAGTVTVDSHALRLAAGRGLPEAVAAAWPGEGPLPRLRRAAAELLASAATGPMGKHSMSGPDLGHALRLQLRIDYKAAVETVPGKKLLTALADDGDGQGLIKCDMKANYARLDVAKLLCGFPRTVASTAAAPTAATTASAVTTGAASTSAAATPVAPTSAATTPTAAQAPLAASPAAHQSPNPSAHQPNASATPLSPSRGTALASLQSALLDLFPDPPRPNACPDPAAASTSSAPAPPSSPSPAALAAWQERQLEARAKRAAAEVLALRGPLQHKHADPARADTPCEELWSRLCQAVAKQLGGRRPARGLKALLLEEQHVFRTMRLTPAVASALLVHPELVRQGVEAQRALAASATDHAVATSAGGVAADAAHAGSAAAAADADAAIGDGGAAAAVATAVNAGGAAAAAPPATAADAQPSHPHAQSEGLRRHHHQQQQREQQQQPAPQPQPADLAAALREAVQRRFPYPPRDAAPGAGRHGSSKEQQQEVQRLEAEAKREAALVLAMTSAGPLPPSPGAATTARFEMPLTKLCVATYKALGGVRPARKLREVLDEEPGAFLVRHLSTSVQAVRLVEPHIVLLGRQAQWQMASTGAAEPAPAGAQAAAAGPWPAQQQQQQQLPREDRQEQGQYERRGAAPAGNAPVAVQELQEPQQGQGQQQDHPLRHLLEQLFPYPQGPSTPDPERLEVEAKRAVAQLLADAPPPHQLLSHKLGAPLWKLLGGRKYPDGLRRLCTLAPHAFEVLPQGTGGIHFTVRVTHPELLAWAAEVQGRQVDNAEEQQQDAPPHGDGRQEHEREQQQDVSAAVPVHVSQQLAAAHATVGHVPNPVPAADTRRHAGTSGSGSSNPPPAAAALLQPQQHHHQQHDAVPVPQDPQQGQGRPQEHPQEQPHPLRRHLAKLFPYPQGASTPDPARLEVEAKRALAQLLVDAPPPHHQLHASALGAPLLQLLGGRRCPDGMRRLCATAPHVFKVIPQATNAAQYSVRLKHAKLLDRAAELHRTRQLQQQQEQEQLRRRQQEEQAQQEQEQGGSGDRPSAEAAAPVELPGEEQDAVGGWLAAAAPAVLPDELDMAVVSVGPSPVPLPSTSNVPWPAVGQDDWGQLGSGGGSDAEARSNGEPIAVANGTLQGQAPQEQEQQRVAYNPMVVHVPVPVPSADAPHHASSSPHQAAYAPFHQQPHAHMLNEDRSAAAEGSVQGVALEHHRGQEQQLEPAQGQGQEQGQGQGQGQGQQEAAAHAFHRYLEQLFPFPADASTLPPDPLTLSLPDELSPSEIQAHAAALLEVEAKRAVAQLLSDAPPPHELLSNNLYAQLRKLLGGRKCPAGGLRRLCLSAPHVFGVLPQEDTSNVPFTVRLTHPELLARAAQAQGRSEREEQQQDAPPHGEGRQEQEREQQQEHGGSAAAAAVHVEQRLASLPMVIPIPTPVPSADAPRHNGISSSSSSSTSTPLPAAPSPLQQQPQQHSNYHYDPLRQHPTQHTHHPFLHHLLLPPHLVQSLPEPTTVYVHWTGARHVTGSPPEPSPSSASTATPSQTHAPAPALGPGHSSWRDAFSQLLTHSRAATQVGVAVMQVAGAPALVALYVPPAAPPAAAVLVQGVPTAGQAARGTSEDSRVIGATVYVIDLAVPQPDSAEAAAAEAEAAVAGGAGQGEGEGQAGGGLEAYTCAVLAALRAVLEDGRVAKVVHGAQQVDALDVTCGQLRSEPLLDTRQLLEAMLLDPFFPNLPPPPPPPPAAPHAHPHAHLLPTARVAEALHASRLRAHVEGVRRALGGTGLWGDRPPLLEVLAAKQHAALSDEYDVAAGKDRVWGARPLPPERVLGAAQRAVHLTELWAALAHEALPWAAMHAAAQAAERRRAGRTAAAAAAAADAAGAGL